MTPFGFPKVQWLRLTGEIGNLLDFYVKFSQNLTRQNHYNRLIFDRVIQKVKGGYGVVGVRMNQLAK